MVKKTLAGLALAGFLVGCGGAETKKPGTTPTKPSTPTAKPADTKPADAKPADKKPDAPAPSKAEDKKPDPPKPAEKK